MLFNTLTFVGFFLIVYFFYVLLHNCYKIQNVLLLVASYVFYGYWDIRFLSLLFISAAVNFFTGKYVYRAQYPGRKKAILIVSILYNLLILGFFKYFNFFSENCTHLLNLVGLPVDPIILQIILPLGLSFYTFQAMTYTIDIYRNKTIPTNNFLDFALFVSFFPTVMSGPIERSTHLLQQISAPRKINAENIDSGIYLILCGYFKKLVIADNIAIVANQIFNNYGQYQGLDILAGILAFTIQLYCDFSGYSDIAIGISKLMGFDLIANFNLPYFARNPSDFWSRWHISLSSWVRDYLYIPLGGNRKGTIRTYINLLITMFLMGLWHGAAWNFIIWGLYHGILLVTHHIFGGKQRIVNIRILSGKFHLPDAIRIILMFLLVSAGWAIFRATTTDQIMYIFTHISFVSSPDTFNFFYIIVLFSLPIIAIELYQYFSRDIFILSRLNPWIRGVVYALFLGSIIVFSAGETMHYIYQGF